MITAVKNPAVAQIKGLIKNASERKKEGVFIAEGKRLVTDILSGISLPEKIFVTEEFFENNKEFFSEFKNIIIVSDKVMRAMSDEKNPQGVLAVFKIPTYEEASLFSKQDAMILVLEDIRDPGNMGTIFRTFEAAGGDGIILYKNCTDVFSPKCIRSTMGSAVRMPYLYCANEGDFYALVKRRELKVFAACIDGDNYTGQDYKGNIAFIIGNEARGISADTLKMANKRISIPMEGKVESLNAAVSAAILSFFAAEKRRG